MTLALRKYLIAIATLTFCAGLLVAWFCATGSEQARVRALRFAPGSEARIAGLTRALEFNPGNAYARAQRSGAYLESGNIPAADADSRRAALAYSAVDFTQQCASVARRAGRTDECLHLLEKARRMQSDSPRILVQLAATLYQQQKYAEARKVAADLNERAPENVDALFLLGVCATALNQTGRVEFYYQQARDALERGEKSALRITTEALKLERSGTQNSGAAKTDGPNTTITR